MADHTKIEWTDATWNPITGCAVVSPGTRLKNHPSRAGLTRDAKAGPVWTGDGQGFHGERLVRVGPAAKRETGRALDLATHDAYPEVAA